MIYPIANISFPRSGHHALKAVLENYFGDQLVYCDNYRCRPENRLTVDPKTNYQKEHDLELTHPEDLPGVRYLIQIRNPIAAIGSWIDFDARVSNVPVLSRDEWRASFQSKLDFWYKWFSKWVVFNSSASRLVVPYSHLIQAPYRTCESVIQYMTGDHPEASRLYSALERSPILARPTRYSTFMGVD